MGGTETFSPQSKIKRHRKEAGVMLFLFMVVRGDLSEKGTFEQRFEKVKKGATLIFGGKHSRQREAYMQRP